MLEWKTEGWSSTAESPVDGKRWVLHCVKSGWINNSDINGLPCGGNSIKSLEDAQAEVEQVHAEMLAMSDSEREAFLERVQAEIKEEQAKIQPMGIVMWKDP